MQSVARLAMRVVLLLSATAFMCQAGAAPADDEENFVDAYRCAVLQRIDFIDAQRRSDQQNRFLVLDVPEKPLGVAQDYVQCAFDPSNARMLCEAASGWWAKDGPRTDYLPKTSVEALAGLGFSTDDSHGNFARYVTTSDENGRLAASELLLKALYRAYGARIGSHLTVTAPLTREQDTLLMPLKCALIS